MSLWRVSYWRDGAQRSITVDRAGRDDAVVWAQRIVAGGKEHEATALPPSQFKGPKPWPRQLTLEEVS